MGVLQPFDKINLPGIEVDTFSGEYADCGSHRIELSITIERQFAEKLRDQLIEELGNPRDDESKEVER